MSARPVSDAAGGLDLEVPKAAVGTPEPDANSQPDAAGQPDAELAALSSDWGGARRRRTVVGPRLGPVGWLRWAWRQLTSMRTALLLLLLLALAAIPGSVLPQRPADPLAVNAWIAANPGIAALLDRVSLFDVFGSPWFSAIYLLLFISLMGCVVPRLGVHWSAIRSPTPPAPRRLDRLSGARAWTTADSDVLTRAADALRARHWRVSLSAAQPGDPASRGWLAAERGVARETGNLLFHVALVLVLIGVAMGGSLGWKGTVIVREGEGFSDMLTQYDSFAPGRFASGDLPPFSFTLTDFNASFERTGSQRGAPRSFSATLAYRSAPDAPVEQRAVSVNAPLRVDGAKVFLVGHGYAPHIRLTDSTGRVVFDDTVVFLPQDGNFTSTGVVKAPDAQPQLGVQALFLPTAGLDAVRGPHSTFPAPDDPALFASVLTGDLGMDTGRPSNVFALDTEGLTQLGLGALRPGESLKLADGQGTLTLVDVSRWASFTISHDPGKPLVLAGAIAAILGLSMSLFIRRRRIWVRVEPAGPDATRVVVAGLARSETTDVAADVEALVTVLGGPPTSREPIAQKPIAQAASPTAVDAHMADPHQEES